MTKLGRPRKQVEEKYISSSFTLTPNQIRWLDERAREIGSDSASAVVRACLRYTHKQLYEGFLSVEEFEALAK